MDTDFIVTCPHCLEYVIIEKMNCGIFRHGIIISNGRQVSPHSRKEKCDYLAETKQIYGCGKPYRIIKEEDEYKAIICDYI